MTYADGPFPGRVPAAALPHSRQTSERFDRLDTATDAPFEELGDIDAPARRFGLENPALRLANARSKLPLRQPGMSAHLRQKPRNLAINDRELTLGHANALSRGNLLDSESDSDKMPPGKRHLWLSTTVLSSNWNRIVENGLWI